MHEYRVVQVFGLNSVELQAELNELAEEGFTLMPITPGNFLVMEKRPAFDLGPGRIWEIPGDSGVQPCAQSQRPTYGDLDDEQLAFKPVPDEGHNHRDDVDCTWPHCPRAEAPPATRDGSCGGCNSSGAVPHIPSCPRYTRSY